MSTTENNYSSGYVIVGSCPKCGAPIYAPMIWQSITPPPSHYSCLCNTGPKITWETGTEEAS